jgi:hypothetical protein
MNPFHRHSGLAHIYAANRTIATRTDRAAFSSEDEVRLDLTVNLTHSSVIRTSQRQLGATIAKKESAAIFKATCCWPLSVNVAAGDLSICL